MEYKKSTYKKPYKKNETTKAVYKPKRGNTDGSGFTVQGEGFTINCRFTINGSRFMVND